MRRVDRITLYLAIPMTMASISFWLGMFYLNKNDPELLVYSMLDIVPNVVCALIGMALGLRLSFEQMLFMLIPVSLIFWNLLARFVAVKLSKK